MLPLTHCAQQGTLFPHSANKDQANISENNKSPEELEREATELQAKRSFADAATRYRQLLEKQPQNQKAQLGLADMQRLAGQYDSAQTSYDALIRELEKTVLTQKQAETNGMLSAAKEGKALTYVQQGQCAKAIPLFETILALDASRWRTLNAIATCLALTKRPNDALTYLNLAEELSDDRWAILNNRATTLLINGKIDEAKRILRTALSQLDNNHPHRPRFALNLAIAEAKSGNRAEAEQVLNRYAPELRQASETLLRNLAPM